VREEERRKGKGKGSSNVSFSTLIEFRVFNWSKLFLTFHFICLFFCLFLIYFNFYLFLFLLSLLAFSFVALLAHYSFFKSLLLVNTIALSIGNERKEFTPSLFQSFTLSLFSFPSSSSTSCSSVDSRVYF
jgi:hypothetical protein